MRPITTEVSPEKRKFYEAVLRRRQNGEQLKDACKAEGQNYVSGWYAIKNALDGQKQKRIKRHKTKIVDIPVAITTSNNRSMLFVGSREDLLNIARELS